MVWKDIRKSNLKPSAKWLYQYWYMLIKDLLYLPFPRVTSFPWHALAINIAEEAACMSPFDVITSDFRPVMLNASFLYEKVILLIQGSLHCMASGGLPFTSGLYIFHNASTCIGYSKFIDNGILQITRLRINTWNTNFYLLSVKKKRIVKPW